MILFAADNKERKKGSRFEWEEAFYPLPAPTPPLHIKSSFMASNYLAFPFRFLPSTKDEINTDEHDMGRKVHFLNCYSSLFLCNNVKLINKYHSHRPPIHMCHLLANLPLKAEPNFHPIRSIVTFPSSRRAEAIGNNHNNRITWNQISKSTLNRIGEAAPDNDDGEDNSRAKTLLVGRIGHYPFLGRLP